MNRDEVGGDDFPGGEHRLYCATEADMFYVSPSEVDDGGNLAIPLGPTMENA